MRHVARRHEVWYGMFFLLLWLVLQPLIQRCCCRLAGVFRPRISVGDAVWRVCWRRRLPGAAPPVDTRYEMFFCLLGFWQPLTQRYCCRLAGLFRPRINVVRRRSAHLLAAAIAVRRAARRHEAWYVFFVLLACLEAANSALLLPLGRCFSFAD